MRRRFIAIAGLFLMALYGGWACSGKSKNDTPDEPEVADEVPEGGERAGQQGAAAMEEQEGLDYTISEADPGAEEAERARQIEGTPLSSREVEELMGRVPAMSGQPEDRVEFAFRSTSKPAPTAGETVETVFPPEAEREEPTVEEAEGPLTILRRAPVGQVDLAPRLSVTFSHPMVPIGQQTRNSAELPVELEPKVNGSWRWVGTRTLLFEPDRGRFPMATDYKVTVPEGTESLGGVEPEESLDWAFQTPAVRVEDVYPTGGPHARDTLMFMRFNQRVDPKKIIEHATVWGGGKIYRPRLAAEGRVEEHPQVRRRAERAPDGHWIAFYLTKDLPADTEFQIGLKEGAASAEGSKVSENGDYETFFTYKPLTLQTAECGWRDQCWPGTPMVFEFNNPLDAAAIDASAVEVSPSIPDMKVEPAGSRLVIRGRTKGRTTYRVTLNDRVVDTFGQRLDEPVEETFKTLPTPPAVYGTGSPKATLDPEGPPSFAIHSVNYRELKVTALRVEPSDWATYLQAHNRDGTELPGEEVIDRNFDVKAGPDDFATTSINLNEALDEEGHGHVILKVRGRKADVPKSLDLPRRAEGFTVWVQSTDIGLQAHAGPREILGWATSLSKGEPMADVEIELAGGGKAAKTGEDGTATLAMPDKVGEPWRSSGNLLLAKKGGDTAFIAESRQWYRSRTGWRAEEPTSQWRWFTFDDRNLYRPGETISLKGWLRRATPAGEPGLAMPESGTSVAYKVIGPRRNELTTGTVEVDAQGGFSMTAALPDDVNLGYAQVEFEVVSDEKTEGPDRRRMSHSFKIQEFRTPTFEVGVSSTPGPHVVGGSARVTAEASYYAGGPLSGADVNWTVEARPTDYAPPGWDGFIFGRWQPWWRPGGGGSSRTESFQGRLGGSGEHAIDLAFEGVRPPEAQLVEANAAVSDVNRQTIGGGDQFLVHPSTAYVGLKTDRWFVRADETLAVDVIAADIDGGVLAERKATVTAERLDWTTKNGEWQQVVEKTETCEVATEKDPVTCEFEPDAGGTWRLTARVRDDQGRVNETQIRMWVAGGGGPVSQKLEREEVQLIPQKETFEPGETAEVLVQAPFEGAEGLATVRREGVERTIRFEVEGTSHTLEIPVEEADVPNINLRVDLVGSTARRDDQGEKVDGAPDRPAYASGDLTLDVSRRSKTLNVEVAPSSGEVQPGSEVSVEVRVTGPEGKPAADSQVALVAVDEAVLAAADYSLGDPVEAFWPPNQSGVEVSDVRDTVYLASIEQLQAAMDGRGYGAVQEMAAAPDSPSRTRAMASKGAARNGGDSIELRQDFRPLAFFAPAMTTDGEGVAATTFELPDNLTRYRVFAVASSGTDQFGTGSSNLTARLPLAVRPSMPRFLNWGDKANLPVVVHNQTGSERTVELATRSRNLEMTGGRGFRFDVPAGDRVELRFPSRTDSAGTARLQFAAASGDWADAAEVSFPVWTPATTEAFATYGTVDATDGTVTEQVEAPEDAIRNFGGLNVTTSSTALAQLTDAFLYLVDYPYDCSEQVASRILGVASLRDVLQAFDAEGLPPKDELEEAVARDIEKLAGLQRPDGGFALWSRGHRAWPYVSVHVTHALAVARDKGFEVPDHVYDRARRYIRDVEERIPADWSPQVRHSIRAYALYVQAKMGSPEPGETAMLAEKKVGDALSLEAAGWLVGALAQIPSKSKQKDELLKAIGNRAVEEAGTAHFADSYEEGEHLLMHSSRRADAIVLEALIRAEPKSGLIAKVARELMGNRTKGRWANTQENVFVLLALDRYFQTYEKTEPDFAANLWLGGKYVGEQTYRERTTEQKRVEVPMKAVWEAADAEEDRGARLAMTKKGKGRLYYRMGMTYAPQSLDLKPLERGFAVERSYEPVDDPDDVRRREDGAWIVEAGSRVRVRVRMVAPTRRHHVALVDPLAGGFEPLNPALATTEEIPDDPKDDASKGRFWWWHRPWFEHQNLRDERAEAFASTVWAGVHTYTYVVRATTPGEFVVPPPKAEEMYHPETFGRGETTRVVVE